MSASALVFSLYVQYILPRGGEIWIGSLIQAMAPLDLTPVAVRALVSRMQRKGYLESRRSGRHSLYRLTELGLSDASCCTERAVGRSADGWDGKWTVVIYSIPEDHRDKRDALRCSLACHGFGAIAPGTWISPHPTASEPEDEWRGLGAWQYVEVFRAEHVGPSDPPAMVSQAWPQLPAIADRYRGYIDAYSPTLCCCEEGTLDNGTCFAAQLRSLLEFDAIRREDPALPSCLLPDGWPRPAAQLLFEDLQHRLAGPADCFFDTVCGMMGEHCDQKR